MNITFVLGGARSGKSAYAERLAAQSSRPKIYIATAEALDTEMKERIAAHQKRRGEEWDTHEIPVFLAEAIVAPEYQSSLLLVDCLMLWLSNLMHGEANIEKHTSQLIEAVQSTQAEVILVSNEVGQGIVPDNALARRFRDEAGVLHQKIASVADHVVWMVAGIPTIIKGQP